MGKSYTFECPLGGGRVTTRDLDDPNGLRAKARHARLHGVDQGNSNRPGLGTPYVVGTATKRANGILGNKTP